MEKRRLEEFITFLPGINQSRAEKQFGTQSVKYYDQYSFESDYNHEDGFAIDNQQSLSEDRLALTEGDVVISNSLQLATIVGKRNVGKVLSLNFAKAEFANEQLDKRYFLYLFNSYKDVRRQKGRELQGSGTVQRIPLRALGQIVIPVIPLEEQKKIGMIYTETLQLQSKLNRYADLMEQFTGLMIEENLKERETYEKSIGSGV